MAGFHELREMGVQFGPFDGPPPPRQAFPVRRLVGRHRRSARARVTGPRCAADRNRTGRGDRRGHASRRTASRVSPAGRLRADLVQLQVRAAALRDWGVPPRVVWRLPGRVAGERRGGRSHSGSNPSAGSTGTGSRSAGSSIYTGWKQLPSRHPSPADAIQTREQAERVIVAASGIQTHNGESLEVLARMAVRKTHPDTGGDETEFRKVQRAREVLGV